MRLALQAAEHEFTVEAENHPSTPITLSHLRVAAEIKELDRQIGMLNEKLSQGTLGGALADTKCKAIWLSPVSY